MGIRLFNWVPMRSAYTHEEHSYKILQYGRRNSYPQEALYALNRSGTASSCVKALTAFTKGNGFANKAYGRAIINPEGDSINDLLGKVSKDFSVFEGFAIHFNVNMLGEYVNATWLPFWRVRWGMPNENGKIDHVRVWDNWANESTRFNANPAEIQSIKLFNPNPDVIMQEIEECGGIENYNGQVLYYTGDAEIYPSVSFDAVFDQVLTNGLQAEFDKNFIQNRYSSSTVFVNEDVSDDDEQFKRNKEEVAKLGGVQNAGSVSYMEGKISTLGTVMPEFDKQHKVVKDSVKDDIIENYNIPPVLVSRTRQGGFPNQDEIINSFDYYNGMTQERRDLLSKMFFLFSSNWHFYLNSTTNYDIMPKTFGVVVDESEGVSVTNESQLTDSQSNLRSLVGSISAVTTLQSSIKRGETQYDAAVSTLMKFLGFSEDEAKSMLGNPPETITPVDNGATSN